MKTSVSSAIFCLILAGLSTNAMADLPPYTTTQQVLNQNRATWQRQNIRSYDYSYQKYGPNTENIMYPLSIEVRNDIGISAQDANHNQILWDWFTPMTFEYFFDIIQSQISSQAKSIDVVYDSLGFPEDLYIVMANNTVYDVSISGFVNRPNRRALVSSTENEASRSLQQSQMDQWTENKQVWEILAIPYYEYSYRQLGSNSQHIVYPWDVTVINDQASGTDGNGNEILYQPGPETMEDFFSRIHDALVAQPPVHSIAVSYDPTYGFPSYMKISYNADVAQSTYETQITSFQKKLLYRQRALTSDPYEAEKQAFQSAENLWEARKPEEEETGLPPCLPTSITC